MEAFAELEVKFNSNAQLWRLGKFEEGMLKWLAQSTSHSPSFSRK